MKIIFKWGYCDVQFNILQSCDIFWSLSVVQIISCVKIIRFGKQIKQFQSQKFSQERRQATVKGKFGKLGDLEKSLRTMTFPSPLGDSTGLWLTLQSSLALIALFLNSSSQSPGQNQGSVQGDVLIYDTEHKMKFSIQ